MLQLFFYSIFFENFFRFTFLIHFGTIKKNMQDNILEKVEISLSIANSYLHMNHLIESQIDGLIIVCCLLDTYIKNWKLIFQISSHNLVIMILVGNYWQFVTFFMNRTYTWFFPGIRKHTLINTTVKNDCKWLHNSRITYLQHSNGNIIMIIGLTDI